MKSFANWMIVMFMGLFWIFRVVVAYMAGNEKSFFVTPIDLTTEIVLLFVTLICIVLVIKRVLFGGILYLISYGGYFGVSVFNAFKPMLSGESFNISMGFNTFISALAIILAIVVLIDLLADKTKKPANKDTEWFYANKDFDRQIDDRADKNNYKTL